MGKIHEDYAALLKLCEEKPKENETQIKVQEFLKNIQTCEPSLLESSDEFGQTLLHKCVMANDVATLSRILPRIKNINLTDQNECTPLYYAVLLKKDRLISPLVEYGADINEKDIAGYTYLHYAIIAGDIKKIKVLINAGANVLFKDGLGQSFLKRLSADETLTKETKIEIINIFLNAGAGLCCDLTDIELPSECYNNALLINANQNNTPLDNTVEKFDRCIFSVDQFQKAIKNGVRFNYNYLLTLTNYLIALPSSQNQSPEQEGAHNNPPIDIADEETFPQIDLTELIKFRDCLSILVKNQDKTSSLKQKMIKDIARNLIIFTPRQIDVLNKNPDLALDLQTEIKKEQKKVSSELTLRQNKK